ncbi:hypothetical protein ACEPPN_003189 [Leptodophora sp. 'Broadleaf-Isolate-01']
MDSDFYDDDFSFFRETGDDISSGSAALSSTKAPAKRRMRKKQKNEKGRKRSSRACDMCHRRKVRCSVVVEGGPCLNCKLDGVMCFIPREEQRKSPKRATTSTQTQTHPDDLKSSRNTSVPQDLIPETCEPRRMPSTSNEECGGPSYDIFEKFPPHLEAADLAYLHSHDALNIPTECFQIALLGGFVDFVYPRMPILDLEEFLSIVKNSNGVVGRGGRANGLASFSTKKLSLLLFQAILFTGVEFVSTKTLSEEGFETREVAREALFNRVRLLYDFDTCMQRLSVIQTLLLMTVCPRSMERSVGFKDAAHWLDQAISFAFSLGLNRHFDLDRSTHRQKSLNRRIWWTLFVQDRTLSLNSGSGIRRTTRIRKEDCKISMATLDDFELDELEDGQTEAEAFKIRANALSFVEKTVLCWSSNPSEVDEFAIVAAKAPQPHYSRSSTNSTRAGCADGTSTGISSLFECQISTPSTASHVIPNSMELPSMVKDVEGLRAILATDGRVELDGTSFEDGAREFSDYMEYIGEAMSGHDKSPMYMVSEVDSQGDLQNPSSAVF